MNSIFNVSTSDPYLNHGDRLCPGAVVRGGSGGTLAPPEFGVSEKRTGRVYYILSVPPDLKT